MAEDTVVKEQLTDAMIDAGAELTRKLDELGLPVTAALWLFMTDINEWRLVFASPHIATKGRRDVYKTIDRAMNEIGAKGAAIPFSVVTLLEPDADPVKLIRAAFHLGGIGRIRFTKNTINGHYIDDALIYRAA